MHSIQEPDQEHCYPDDWFRQVMILSGLSSTKELGLLLVCLFMATLSFGNMGYLAETISRTHAFHNVPEAVYWAVITLTTVG
jgi:hypothetical protein